MSGPIIQNVSVPANDDCDLDFTLLPSSGPPLDPGTEIYFNVYDSAFGVPTAGVPAIISKTIESGISITDPQNMLFTVEILEADTAGLLRNYYYEVTVVDTDGNRVTTTVGTFTVTATENR